MKNRSSTSALRALLREYLAAVERKFRDTESPPPPTAVVDDEIFHAEIPRPARFGFLEQMIEVLGPRYELPDARQLEGLIVERIEEHWRDVEICALDDTVLLDALVKAIQVPLREYRFSVQCSGGGEKAYNVDFSGFPLIRLAAMPVDTDPGNMDSSH